MSFRLWGKEAVVKSRVVTGPVIPALVRMYLFHVNLDYVVLGLPGLHSETLPQNKKKKKNK